MNKDYGIVVQARLTSTRYPSKLFSKIGKYPVIQWVIERLNLVNKNIPIIVVIPDNKKNKPLYDFLNKLDCFIIRGDEFNVASRFKKAINDFELKSVIRVCADNPLIDPNFIKILIDYFIKMKLNYAFNHIPYHNINIVDGLGAEIFDSKYFLELYKDFYKEEQFEHVTIDMLKSSSKINIAYRKWMIADYKLDIDYQEDRKNIINFLKNSSFDLKKINPKKINTSDFLKRNKIKPK